MLHVCRGFLPQLSCLNTSPGFSTSHKDCVMDRVTVLLIHPCLTITVLDNVTARVSLFTVTIAQFSSSVYSYLINSLISMQEVRTRLSEQDVSLCKRT